MWIGSNLCGRLLHYLTDETTKEKDWTAYWLAPAVGVMSCLVIFCVFFRDSDRSKRAAVE